MVMVLLATISSDSVCFLLCPVAAIFLVPCFTSGREVLNAEALYICAGDDRLFCTKGGR